MKTRFDPARLGLHRLRRRISALVAVGILASAGVAFSGLGSAPAFATYYPVPVVQVAPVISGTPVVGNTLTLNSGTWLGQPVLFYNYSWSDSKNSQLSAGQTYTVKAADIGEVLTARVTVQDGNNHTAYAQVMTAPVTASDVVGKVAPKLRSGYVVGDTVTLRPGTFTSGSGALTYTYAWSRTDGVTSAPLKDTGLTHVITTADLGDYFSVKVTASSATQFGTATVRSPGVAVPKPPVSSDAGLDASNKGTVTATSAKGVATITDPTGAKGDGVFVYGYSQPTQLGWFALDAAKRFTVNFQQLTPGDHRLVVMNQAGKMVGWVSVVRPQQAGATSGSANPLIAVGAAIIIIAIVIVIIVTQRRRRTATQRRH